MRSTDKGPADVAGDGAVRRRQLCKGVQHLANEQAIAHIYSCKGPEHASSQLASQTLLAPAPMRLVIFVAPLIRPVVLSKLA